MPSTGLALGWGVGSSGEQDPQGFCSHGTYILACVQAGAVDNKLINGKTVPNNQSRELKRRGVDGDIWSSGPGGLPEEV